MQDRRHPRASGERRPRCLRGSPQGSAASGLLRRRAGRRVPASAPAPGCHRPFDIRDLVSTRFTADTWRRPPIACTCASRQTALTDGACRMLTDVRQAGRVGGARGPLRDCAPGESRERHRFAPSCPIPPSARAVPTGFRRRTAIRGSSPCRRVASSGAAWGGVALARLKSTLPADRRPRFNRPASRGARAPASRRARIRGACPRPGNSRGRTRGRTPGRRRRNEGERP